MSSQLNTKSIECLTNHGTVLKIAYGFPGLRDYGRNYHYKFNHQKLLKSWRFTYVQDWKRKQKSQGICLQRQTARMQESQILRKYQNKKRHISFRHHSPEDCTTIKETSFVIQV